MRTGALRHRCCVEQNLTPPGDVDQQPECWRPLVESYYVSRNQTGVVDGKSQYEMTGRYYRGIEPGHRVVFHDLTVVLTEVADMDSRNTWLTLKGVAA